MDCPPLVGSATGRDGFFSAIPIEGLRSKYSVAPQRFPTSRHTMVDKSKMTVAEMLAAARKQDSQGGAPADPAPPASAAESAEATAAPSAAATPPAAKKPAAGGKPSVAAVLAMARAKKDASATTAPA